jgi:2-dehydro-3-deoxyphosphogluconate aldolase/(4S)-4-hydroxy-2-oxoglutarate aldolase
MSLNGFVKLGSCRWCARRLPPRLWKRLTRSVRAAFRFSKSPSPFPAPCRSSLSSRTIGDAALIGAGTVLDSESARACVDAGARFIVSPALDLPTIETCSPLGVPVFAGALTPTEIVTAWRAGANAVKIFPANAVGGATYLKSIKAPLPQIELLPTGGVSLTNAAEFIRAGVLALGVGADLVDLAALRRGEAAAITDKARQYVAAVAAARST